ncbi:MAG: 7TM diverse intracellular signaling domain-containing protein, partial [Planctomycetota bacterium]
MKKNGIFSTLIVVSLALFFLNACKSDSLNMKMPRVENGMLDLSTWDLENDGPVSLSGEWEFYWYAHLKQADLSNETPPAMSGFIEVPGTWNGYRVNGEKISGKGYATYRLRIRLAKTGQILAFKFLDMAVAFSVYVNGKKIMSAGIPGKDFESTVPQFYPQVVELNPGSKQLEVVILVSNFHHRKGGAWEPILLGLKDDMRQIRQKALYLNFFLFGGILIMGIYHIGLFVFRTQEKSTLFFGIFCFLIAIRSLVTGERYLIDLFPNFNWEVHTKIAYLTFYAGVPVFAMYARNIFSREISKPVIHLIAIVGAFFSAVIIITPARIYTHTSPFFQIFAILAFLYGLYVLILCLYRKRQGARFYLAGFVVLFITLVNDILYSNLIIETGYMIQLGLLVFIFSQAFLLSLLSSKAFATVELQSRKLEDTNKAYKQEIVERRRTEEALRESEEKYRLLVENSNEAVVVAQEGMLRFFNARTSELSGYSEGELKSRPFIEMIHPEDRDLVQKNYLRRINGEPAPETYVFRVMHKDGSVKWANISAVKISWEGAPATLNFLMDITEKRQLEEELQKAQKLESIGVLAGGIAHDFNNILVSIMGNISLAKMDVNQHDTIYKLLEKAENASKRATDLTQQLLTFSRGGAPIKKVTTISDVIVDCSAFVVSGSNVRCDFNMPADLWPVEIDVGQIGQVIQNIIINAEQAMPDGGIIRISAENTFVESNHGLPLKPGKYVKIDIQDQGTGIPEVYLNKIFDPYFTSKQKGSGLGLTTAFSIIRKHDGHIVAKSQLEAGTTFTVYLPSSKEKVPQKTEDRHAEISGKGKILAMDDEEMIRDLVGDMLNRLGYEAEVARHGEEAIHIYRRAIESGEPFDAVILDLTVPGGMGGKETIERLRELDSNLKAIVSSGYSNDPIMSEPKKYGFSSVVVKPFDI